MSINKDILEGMVSAFDLSGSKNFNSFKNYPRFNKSIRKAWLNTGLHISNAMGEVAQKRGLKDYHKKRSASYPEV